jgi:hypothetical protein
MAPRRLFNFLIDADLAAALKQVKKDTGIPESEQVRRAITEWMERRRMIAKTNRKRGPAREPVAHAPSARHERWQWQLRQATGSVSNLRQTSRGVLWLVDAERTRYQLTVVFQGGWRIVSASPEEQALLQAHGFASGWLQ